MFTRAQRCCANTHLLRIASRRIQPVTLVQRHLATFPSDEKESRYVMPTYSSGGVRSEPGLVFVSGKGCVLTSEDGKKYIDFGSGIAVNVLGYGDEEWAKVVADQAMKLAHISNLFHSTPQLDLAQRLVETSSFSRIFFANSGAEANEGALKFARLYATIKENNPSPTIACKASDAKKCEWVNGMCSAPGCQTKLPRKNRLIAFMGGFHGRTVGSLSLTHKPEIRYPFAPLLAAHVTFLPFNDVEAFKASMGDDVCAVFVEPVQGEGGINPATLEFMQTLRSECDKHDSILVCDEVQTGLGRAGPLWAHQAYGIQPDLMTVAKPLAGGLPIGAVFVSQKLLDAVPESKWKGAHGTTFGANPLVCAAALSVVNRLLAPGFLQKSQETGAYLVSKLRDWGSRYPELVSAVRAPLGDAALFVGVEFPPEIPIGDLVSYARKHGILLITCGYNVLRVCPPLTVSRSEVDQMVQVLESFAKEKRAELMASAASGKFLSKAHHRAFLATHRTLPQGFRVGAIQLPFVPQETMGNAKMNITVIVPDKPTDKFAGVFTTNKYPGAPVLVAREILKNADATVGAILVNTRVANVHRDGQEDAKAIGEVLANHLGLPHNASVLPASTGVIGWRLPVKDMQSSVPTLLSQLGSGDALTIAERIVTTDSFPKIRSVSVGAHGRIVGAVKGAGMVEPNMATMLGFILTDVAVPRALLQKMLVEIVDDTFNAISVDSDQSTSDMVVVLSSGAVPFNPADHNQVAEFRAGLQSVCKDLAHDVVRNGEGTEHVMEVTVKGLPSKADAKGIAKFIVNSPLVKTAIYGNDPNVGRIAMAVGDYLSQKNMSESLTRSMDIRLCGKLVLSDGRLCLTPELDKELTHKMKTAMLDSRLGFPKHYEVVPIEVDCHSGDGIATVLGSDLSIEYIYENTNYRS